MTTQVAIVTGASSGVGFETALKLAGMGMAVVDSGRDQERLNELEKAVGDPQRVATLAIASSIAFLCTSGASFINGQTIVVEAGWSSTKYLSDFAVHSTWTLAEQ